MLPETKRWIGYGAFVALVVLWGREGSSHRPASALTPMPADRSPTVSAGKTKEANAPELDLEQLARAAQVATTADLFEPRSWAELTAQEARQSAPPPPPPPPDAPPLPYAYMGKLVDGANASVFLMKGDRNYIVRSGDTIDGAYRVDEVGDQSMTLTYLPLDTKQSLAVGSPALSAWAATHASGPTPAVSPSAAALPGASAEPARLVWLAPARAGIGEEFTVEVGLPAGPQPRSGRVELVYDGRVLAVLGGAAAAPAKPTESANARRAVVEVIGPGFPGAPPTPSEVRFRVLAADPTRTQISIENLSAVAEGSPLVVASPATHPLAIVQSEGLRSKSN